jgi:hypothetical protein
MLIPWGTVPVMCAKAGSHKCELAYSFAGCVKGEDQFASADCWRHAAGQHVGLWCNGLAFAELPCAAGNTDRWKRLAYRTGWLTAWQLFLERTDSLKSANVVIRHYRGCRLKIDRHEYVRSCRHRTRRTATGPCLDWTSTHGTGSIVGKSLLEAIGPECFAPLIESSPKPSDPIVVDSLATSKPSALSGRPLISKPEAIGPIVDS